METNYLQVNKDLWNKRTEVHLTSEFYDQPNFIRGNSSLNQIELDLLGDIKGKELLHLQCHFGQDTLSLARLGATVTGVDLSDKAIEAANNVKQELGLSANFVCCDVYDLPGHIQNQFDIIFTSYGVVGWLPDLNRWASIISTLLKPGGKFIIVEFHPVVWMYDNDFEKVEYSYFKNEPIVETELGTYADTEADLQLNSVTWNHSLSEVFSALSNHGMAVTSLNEYDYSPYNCFKHTKQTGPKKFVIEKFGNKIPLVYSMVAVKQ